MLVAIIALTVGATTGQTAPQVTVRPAEKAEVQAQAEGHEPDILLEEAIDVTVAVPSQHARAFDFGIGFELKNADMQRYVVDQARVEEVSLKALKDGKKINVQLGAVLTSEWYRQDVDIVLELRDTENDATLHRETWNDLTIGNGAGPYSGGTRTPTAVWKLKKGDATRFLWLLAADRLQIRCRLAIDDD